MDISNAAVTNWDYQDVSNPPKTWNVCLPFSKGRALVSQPDVLAFGLFFCSFFSAIGGLVLLYLRVMLRSGRYGGVLGFDIVGCGESWRELR